MPRYVDGFVLVVPKKNLEAYKKLAKKASKVWIDHGALDYVECVGDTLNTEGGLPFAKLVKKKPSEVVVFSWITYRSKKSRDATLKKVMADSRLDGMDMNDMPFDMKKMSYGGFIPVVDVSAK